MCTTLSVISIGFGCASIGSIFGFFLAASFRLGNSREEDQKIYEQGYSDGHNGGYKYIVINFDEREVNNYKTYNSALSSVCFENSRGWNFDSENMIVYLYGRHTQIIDYVSDATELCALKDNEDEKAYRERREHERSESERTR